ncbi:uncharacterized protein [Arachis hypogaea]|uniref:uncharacterized protein n=1 Tax=Arachis hypogaea TaxID=3818 RepID=UPI000DEDC567|nr:uncharacterized protein LOC112777952 [Arachis hypogaea]
MSPQISHIDGEEEREAPNKNRESDNESLEWHQLQDAYEAKLLCEEAGMRFDEEDETQVVKHLKEIEGGPMSEGHFPFEHNLTLAVTFSHPCLAALERQRARIGLRVSSPLLLKPSAPLVSFPLTADRRPPPSTLWSFRVASHPKPPEWLGYSLKVSRQSSSPSWAPAMSSSSPGRSRLGNVVVFSWSRQTCCRSSSSPLRIAGLRRSSFPFSPSGSGLK